jgi:opacity protein-like surface antigen
MKKLLLAGAAALVVATPAVARDNSPYVGIEGGVLFPKKQTISGNIDFTTNGTPGPLDFARAPVANVRYKTGYDLDVVGGYDFGMFRLEGELGYKRAKAKSLSVNDAFVSALNAGAGTAFTSGTNFGLDNHTTVLSAMVNALADFGGETGIGGYIGAGAGYADVKQFGESSGKFAWQILAGVYAPVSSNIDVGLKYRYFRAGRSNSSDTFAFNAGAGPCGTTAAPFACSGGTATFDSDGRFTSHSLLASLIYNFGAPSAAPAPTPPPPPPPPPPAAPATQTCPDGSVILATSTCPAPPPPPPPPPAPTERGERGR